MSRQLREAAGSVLVVGLGATELTGLEKAWLRLMRPAGIILFRRNIEQPTQTRELLKAASSLCDPSVLRCVDVEGGTVDRLRDAVHPMPSPQAVARTGNQKWMRLHGELIAREVAAFGFNTTLAPVLDLALPPSFAVMGTRTAGASPAEVATYSALFLNGLASQGVIGCGKHFPGLGGAALDSHLETPAIGRSWSQLWNDDLMPYRQLARALPMVMINHATYPATGSKHTPATASHYWATEVLRNKIGYRGLIFSDDLEMGGILNFASIEESAILAMRAGIHLIEICHSPELILRTYESLLREAERSPAFSAILLERARAGSKLRKARFAAAMKPALSAPRFTALQDRVRNFAEQVSASQ